MENKNILFIMCDKMVADVLGCYGDTHAHTPNIVRLAREGIRFDAAYSPVPVCAPALACLSAGMYGSNINIYDNASALRSDFPCIPHYLTNAGYDCVLSGKMHYIGPDQHHGYRARFLNNIYPSGFDWTSTRMPEGPLFSEWTVEKFPVKWSHAQSYTGKAPSVGQWHKDLVYDEETHYHARQYLAAQGVLAKEEARRTAPDGGNKKLQGLAAQSNDRTFRPFFLTVSYHHPHEPFHPPKRFWELFEEVDVPIPDFPEGFEERLGVMDKWLQTFHGCDQHNLKEPDGLKRLYRAYYALCAYVDEKVGELISDLEEYNLLENTYIIFTSDHGDMLCWENQVQKRLFRDWSCKVPLIMRFPEKQYAGRVIDAPVNLVDLLPTFTDMAGYHDPAIDWHDGQSLIPLITGEQSGTERYTFAEMHTDGTFAPCFMVRKGQWKYNYVHGHDEQLFDMANDRRERNNLADSPDHQKLKSELKDLLLKHFDPEQVEADICKDLPRRRLIHKANLINKTNWNAKPDFNHNRNNAAKYLR